MLHFFRFFLVFTLITFSQLAISELRVMTINTEWLWTPYDNHVDGSKVNRKDMSKKRYLAELHFYAKMIKQHRVDIVALAEIENEYVAKDLARTLGNGWSSYFKQGRDTATGQDVGILSQLELVPGTVSHYGFPCGRAVGAKKRKCLSKVLGVAFEHQGHTFSVLTAHFLSKRKESRAKNLKRQSQALALVDASKQAQALISAEKREKLIVMGDFNDTLQSKTLNILMAGAGLKSSQGCGKRVHSANSQKDVQDDGRIDHILFRGFECKKEFTVPTASYSDHDAIIAVLQ